ncbi:hypothetical protein V1273_004096 [Bradyrhizobium sp. AZCC 1721]
MRGMLAPIPYLMAALTLAGCLTPTAQVPVASEGGLDACR